MLASKFNLIRAKRKKWPTVIQRRIVIAGKKCAIFSASRTSRHKTNRIHSYITLRVEKTPWAEYQLVVIRNADGLSDVLVIPRRDLDRETTVSLNNWNIVRYKNAWSSLSAPFEPAAIDRAPVWRRHKVSKPPTKKSVTLSETVEYAEKKGYVAEYVSEQMFGRITSQHLLLISKRHCQVMTARFNRNKQNQSIAVNLPTSNWVQFVILLLKSNDGAVPPTYYVIPKEKILRRTTRSLNSKWLRQFKESWALLS